MLSKCLPRVELIETNPSLYTLSFCNFVHIFLYLVSEVVQVLGHCADCARLAIAWLDPELGDVWCLQLCGPDSPLCWPFTLGHREHQ